jgi:hypothetical protein
LDCACIATIEKPLTIFKALGREDKIIWNEVANYI